MVSGWLLCCRAGLGRAQHLVLAVVSTRLRRPSCVGSFSWLLGHIRRSTAEKPNTVELKVMVLCTGRNRCSWLCDLEPRLARTWLGCPSQPLLVHHGDDCHAHGWHNSFWNRV